MKERKKGITVLLNEDFFRQVDVYCKKIQRSKTDLVRSLLRDHIESEKRRSDSVN
jgi:metal-responsive CopG/Arc/MetJ family transcriptional regulator